VGTTRTAATTTNVAYHDTSNYTESIAAGFDSAYYDVEDKGHGQYLQDAIRSIIVVLGVCRTQNERAAALDRMGEALEFLKTPSGRRLLVALYWLGPLQGRTLKAQDDGLAEMARECGITILQAYRDATRLSQHRIWGSVFRYIPCHEWMNHREMLRWS